MTNDHHEQALHYPLPRPAAVLDPPTEWTELRQQCPMAEVTLPSGDKATLLTRYDDIKQVMSDPRFTRDLSGDNAARLSDKPGGPYNSKSALPQSGDVHQRWRRMISKWLTAKRMIALRPGVEAMAEQLIDDMIKQGQPADLKAGLGFPLPVWVICDMLGVPASARDKFAYWSNAMLSMTQYTMAEKAAAQAEFSEYMTAHVAAKRAEPADDVLSALIIDSDSAGEPLSDATLVITGQALLVGGHETTANMLTKMVTMLLIDRRRWEQLVANPSLVRTAVEEAMRYDANPGFAIPRFIDEEVEVAGTVFPAGTTVLCELASANRDESAFHGADDMDLTRSPNQHIAFGAGPHSCIGQPLARTELQAMLTVLLRKLPTLNLAVPNEDLRRVEGLIVSGLTELPVRW